MMTKIVILFANNFTNGSDTVIQNGVYGLAVKCWFDVRNFKPMLLAVIRVVRLWIIHLLS